MDPLFLLGFVLLGALLIGLGLGHKSWQVHHSRPKRPSGPSPKQSAQKRSAAYQRPVNPQESHLSSRQVQLQSSHNQLAATGVNRAKPPIPTKSAVTQTAANHRQQMHSAVSQKQKQISRAQPINPIYSRTQTPPPPPPKVVNGSSSPPPAPPSHLLSRQPQGRLAQNHLPRRTRSINNPSELISPQPNYTAYNPPQGDSLRREQAQIKQTPMPPLQRAKTVKPTSEITPPPTRYSYADSNQARRGQTQHQKVQRRQTQQRQVQQEQTRIRQARMKQTQRKAAQQVNSVDAPSDYLMPQLKYPAFKPTQMRPARQVNPVNQQPSQIPPLPKNSASKRTHLGTSWRANLDSDWPGSFPTE